MEITDREFELLSTYLRDVSGIDVPEAKRYLFKTRLGRFLEEEGLGSFSELHNRLTASTDRRLTNGLVQAMTTHESGFFRDEHPFAMLRTYLLPHVAKLRKAESIYLPARIRILSAGCSLGQEPYSIAMCVRQWLATQEVYTEADITILATDISSRVLERARKGVYTELELGRHLGREMRDSYFADAGGRWVVNQEVRRMVGFAPLNLAEPIKAMGKFDIVFCRNVIIYFPVELKQAILDRIHRMLNAGGALILGASESTYRLSDAFTAVRKGGSTYYTPKETAVDR